jgi:hypothetical protein
MLNLGQQLGEDKVRIGASRGKRWKHLDLALGPSPGRNLIMADDHAVIHRPARSAFVFDLASKSR